MSTLHHRASRDDSADRVHPPSTVFLDAAADARNLSRDALAAGVDLFQSIIADPEAGPVERYLAAERLHAFDEETASRDLVDRLATGQATPHDRNCGAWDALREAVKQRVEVPDVLAIAGVPLRRAGASRGRPEFCGPCPRCEAGDDRLRAWAGPSGRCWCRVCEWSADVIGVASLITRTGQFRDCVRWLANYAGIPAPEPLPAPNTTASAGIFEFRNGKLVPR